MRMTGVIVLVLLAAGGAAWLLRDELLARVGPLAQAIRAQKVLASRAHPWCFFPEKTLKKFLLLESD